LTKAVTNLKWIIERKSESVYARLKLVFVLRPRASVAIDS
jgi:hypothetical protein